MLNAPAGVLRAIARLRPTKSDPSRRATRLHRRSVGVARSLGAQIASFRTSARPAHRRADARRRLPTTLRRNLLVRFGSDRALPIGVAVIVLLASVISLQPAVSPVGAVQLADSSPRIAIGGGGGGVLEADGATPSDEVGVDTLGTTGYVDDGTLYKPVAVDTSVTDATHLLITYTVQSGDSLTGIASRFGVKMMTIWWANKLTSKDALHVGQKLVIPPVDGLIVTVAEGDTIEGLAARYKVDTQSIVDVNGLEDPTLVIGQALIMPGAAGAPYPTPKPTPRPKSSSGGGSYHPPVTYSGGRFSWPVLGGNNYISQYFHYGHEAIDIAADYGARVVAAGSGTVIFAGWKSNGGGYQVWIAHGSGLYTTYNHMSAITTSSGRSVSKGTQVGRVGQSGHATGPHLHFEVWIGPVWNGGYRVNPLRYF